MQSFHSTTPSSRYAATIFAALPSLMTSCTTAYPYYQTFIQEKLINMLLNILITLNWNKR